MPNNILYKISTLASPLNLVLKMTRAASPRRIFTFIICKHIVFDQFSKFFGHFISSHSSFVPFCLFPYEINHWRFPSKMFIIVPLLEVNLNEFDTAVPRQGQLSIYIVADNSEMLGWKKWIYQIPIIDIIYCINIKAKVY